jgi:hypothetical protein
MSAREQADELQIRCAWVRLRAKASAKVMRNPARSREILDRIAADEAKTLAAIGGAELAALFVRTYKAADPAEILSEEAAFVVHAETNGALAAIGDAPSVVPALPGESKSKRTRSRQRKPATA